ncbi:hypothetical protein [Dokdonia sp.]|uniref:hypothetical protein n=1 Tax=Dokdonia sp. TaxID=2024995 RepID=UPI0032673376
MKKLVVLAVLFLGGMTAQANEVTNLDHNNNTTGIRYNVPQSISFVQRGVKFIVYPNGEFDFRFSNPQHHGRRGHNAPGTTYSNRGNRGYVAYDYLGNATKVGRNYIGYNRNCDVNQIGNITLRYAHGRLVRVGNLRVYYDHYGDISHTKGYVTHYSHNNNYNTYDNDNDHYYGRKRNRNAVKRNGRR